MVQILNGFPVAAAVDIVFVALVAFVCWQSLSRSDGRTRRWKHELLRLEEMLRELLAEASAASSNLDRSLLRRKEELQALIRRLEDAKLRVNEPPTQAPRRRSRSAPSPELPNPTWTHRPPPRRERSPLEALAEERRDTVKLSEEAPDNLSRHVEVLPAPPTVEERGFVGEAVDPIAYKVAMRLLASGQEIHVVARKLGLPVAEVRLIDKLVQSEQGRRAGAPAAEEAKGGAIERESQML